MERNAVKARVDLQTNRSDYFQMGLLLLNVISVMLISVFVYSTTEQIRGHYAARKFLSGVRAIPWQPLWNVWICSALLLLLAALFVVRKTGRIQDSRLLYGSFFFDFLISFCLIFLLDFNYNGIILFVFACMLTYTRDNRWRYLLMLLAVGSFFSTDYELVAINAPLYSIRDYIAYHDPGIQQYLFGVYNGLITLNIIAFILYCVAEINTKQDTIDQVNDLYRKLSTANQDLETANEQLREYAQITEKMAETRERNRMAREIHDTLGHTLTGISMGIEACITTLDTAPDETRRRLELISRVTREGIVDVRRSVNRLRADAMTRFSLEHAVMKMITDAQAVTGATINFRNYVGSLNLDEDEENAIYRVIQESVTNAVRHGKASQIDIQLKKENSNLLLTVKDNGVGCLTIGSGFGLQHIQERIQLLGGTVSFDGKDGFLVSGKIPIRWGKVTEGGMT